MLILQIPPRTVIFEGTSFPTFPARATINVKLAPEEAFGEADLSGKLSIVPHGHQVRMSTDLRNGGIRFQGGGRLPKLQAEGPLFDARIQLDGAHALVEHACPSEGAFKQLIRLVENQVPAVLSVPLRAPVEVVSVSGSVGPQRFRVEFCGVIEAPIRTADLTRDVQEKLERLQHLPAQAADRVFSAHRYLLQAYRLRYISEYPGQFLGERLLNLYKVLEVLFGRKADDLRASLQHLGLRDEVVELLVGLVYVRDESDVGHPAIQQLDAASYESVHKYVFWAEEVVTWLLDHLLDRLPTTENGLKPLNKSPSKRLGTLVAIARNINQVNPLQPHKFLRDEPVD